MAAKILFAFRVSGLTYRLAMKVLPLLISVCLVSGCGYQPPKHDATFIANRSGVLFYGDSIFGKWDLDSYFPGENYVNGGHFGKRTDELLAALPDALSGKNVCSGFDGNPGDPSSATLKCRPIPPPATIVILAGWNNMFQGYSVDARPDLEKMVGLSEQAGVRVIICTVYRFDRAHPAPWMMPEGTQPITFYDVWRDPMNDAIRNTSYGARLLDLDRLFTDTTNFTSDGIHPDAFGYRLMQRAIDPFLNGTIN